MLLLVLIAGYLAALAGVTLAVRRRHGAQQRQSPRTFFVADGRLSVVVTASSLTATSVGGSSTVVTAALVHQHGLAGIWLDLAGAIGFVILGLMLARRVRRTDVSSIAELAGLRYGPSTRRVTATLVLVAELAWLALLAKAAASLLAPALPQVGSTGLVAATLLIVVAYTSLGGQHTVAYSDVVQLAVMVVGLCAVAPVAVARRLGRAGVSALPLHFPTSATLGWSGVGGLLLLNGLPHAVGSDIYAKVLSARDGQAAARGALVAAALKTIIAVAVTFVALGGARLLPAVDQPAALLGEVVHRLLAPSLAAPLLLALLATMMSSADQVLLSAVTMTCHDLWPGRPWLLRLSPWLYGAVAALFALGMPTVVDLMKVGYTVFVTGLSLPVVASLYDGLPLARRAVSAAMVAGALVGGGLHAARLAGVRLVGDPIYWGLLVCFALLVVAWLSSSDGSSFDGAGRGRSRAERK